MESYSIEFMDVRGTVVYRVEFDVSLNLFKIQFPNSLRSRRAYLSQETSDLDSAMFRNCYSSFDSENLLPTERSCNSRLSLASWLCLRWYEQRVVYYCLNYRPIHNGTCSIIIKDFDSLTFQYADQKIIDNYYTNPKRVQSNNDD